MNNKRFWISLLAGIMAGIMIITLLLQLIPTPAQAATSSEIKNQINQMEKDQKELQAQLDKLEAQRKENLNEIQEIVEQKDLVDQQVTLLHEQIDSMNEQISAYAVLIADKQAELDEAEVQLQEMKQKHMERLRAMEEDGQMSYWSVLFEANSFTDFLDRMNMVQEIAAADQRRMEEMSIAADAVAETQEVLRQEQADLQDSREAMAAKQVELDKKAEQSKALLAQLVAKGEEFEAYMADAEDELSDLEDEIMNMEAEYDKKKYEEWLATSKATSPAATNKPTSGSIYKGGTALTPNKVDGITWLTPCNYNRIASTFGNRFHPVDHVWKMHKGVDLAVNCTPIYATRGGVVITAGWDNSAGNWVVIDHGDGFKSVYMHMCKRPYVRTGDFVGAGQEIGCVGSTGKSTGDHLHFGISKYNPKSGAYEYVNPLEYIKN